MSLESLLNKNAITLSALRDLCIAYDINNSTSSEKMHGFGVFSYVAIHVFRDEVGSEDYKTALDQDAWEEQVATGDKPSVFFHGTLQVKVASSDGATMETTAEAIDEESDEDLFSALVANGEMQMLKEGADPKDESSWFPVGSITDIQKKEPQ